MNTPNPTPRTTTRRAFSFLEAVLAAALLGIIAASIFSTLGYIWNAEHDDTDRLGAAEVANRVLISYLDDNTSTRRLPDVIHYGKRDYRWKLDEHDVRLEEPNRRARITAGTPGAVPNALVHLKEISVTAWLDDGTPETLTPGTTPAVRLNRLVNPIAYRGADTIDRLLNSPERRSDLFRNLTGFEAPDSGGTQ
ncbi:MAG TPA: hypothetical protein ENJ00_01795 [Phycisphaerales bacterium]|nr:hypothetical protein [Phycisphaerales bacterium]